MNCYTIFDRPEDYPACVVVRRFRFGAPTPEHWLCNSVAEARAFLLARFPGLACFGRAPSDPPHVVETWL